MRRVIAGWVFACLCLPVLTAAQTSRPLPAPTPRDAAKLIAKLPVHFEALPGSDGAHHYTASGPGYRVELGATSIHVGLIHGTTATPRGRKITPEAPFVTSTVSMELLGANASAPGMALEPSASTSSYFLGDDPTAWHSGVSQFGRLLFTGVYPGIDVAYYGSGGQLEHDFIVHAGSDPASIRLAFSAQRLQIDPEGALVLSKPADGIRLLKPVAYQTGGDGVTRKEVECHFRLAANGEVGFVLGAFDRKRTLVIDPTLTYASYFGNSNTVINGIAVDGSGNIFIAGLAPTYGIPTKNATIPAGTGTYNAFLTKLDPTGATILFSTYIGGNTQDEALALALDSSGNAYIAGLTQSTNFPTLHAVQTSYGVSSCYSSFVKCFNGFVTAVKADGSALLYSTYLGGSVDDRVEGIAVDATGAAYLTGYTKSGNFPLKNAYQGTLNTNCSNPSTGSCQDAFVTKLDSTGAIVFSTYLGGTGAENGVAVTLDSTKNIYVTGSTGSSNFPSVGTLTYNGSALSLFSGAFLTEMAADGQSLVFSHIVATGQGDAIALDSTGIYVAGSIANTINAVVPTTTGAFSTTAAEMYALKLKPDGSGFLYGTYLGGLANDLPSALAVDGSGDAWIAGYTTTNSFPTVNALQSIGAGIFAASTNGGTTFAAANTGLIASSPTLLLLDSSHPGTLLLGEYNAALSSCTSSGGATTANCGGLFTSTNTGAIWTRLTTTGLTDSRIVSGFRSQSTSTTLYVLTPTGIFSSTDNGSTWTKPANTGLPTLNGTSQEIAGDPANASVVYFTQASVGTPLVFRSADSGATFSSVSTGLPTSGNLSFLVPDTTNAGTLYAAIGTKIYKTINSGAAWTLPNSTGVPYSIVGLSLDPSNTMTVYVGTALGYFKSTDAAATFTAGNSSFSVNTAITVDPTNSSILYARVTQAGYYAIKKSTDGGTTFSPTPFTNAAPSIVVIDPTNNSNIYVATNQTPTAFLAELDPNGANLLYSSYYGGNGWTEFWALALSGSNIYVAGLTNSTNNTTTNNGAQPSLVTTSTPGSAIGSHTRYSPRDDSPPGNNNPNDPGTGSTLSPPPTGPSGGIVDFFSNARAIITLTDTVTPGIAFIPPADQTVKFNLTVTNTATILDAQDINVTWNPPSNTGFQTDTSVGITIWESTDKFSTCSVQGATQLICSRQFLEPGASVTFTIYQVPDRSGTYSDSAMATAQNAPTVTAASTLTVNAASADIAVSNPSWVPNPVFPDRGYAYFTVTNNGPNTADVSVEGNASSNLYAGYFSLCDENLTLDNFQTGCILKNLAPGNTRQVRQRLTSATRAVSGTATDVVTVSPAPASDPNLSNNTAQLSLNFTPPTAEFLIDLVLDLFETPYGDLTAVSSPTTTPHAVHAAPRGGGTGNPSGIVVDNSGNFWIAGPSSLGKFDSSRNFVATYTGAGMGSAGANSTAISIDGASSLWITNSNNTLSQFSNTGAAISPSGGYASLNLNSPSALAIDRAGTVWITNSGDNSVTRVFGGATPVNSITSGVVTGTQGSKP